MRQEGEYSAKSTACGAASVRGAVWVPCIWPGLRHVHGLHHWDRRAVRAVFACKGHAAAALCVGCRVCHGALSAQGRSRGRHVVERWGWLAACRGLCCTALHCACSRHRPPCSASPRWQALHLEHAGALTGPRSARRGADVVLAGRAAVASGRVDHPQAAAREAHLLRGQAGARARAARCPALAALPWRC